MSKFCVTRTTPSRNPLVGPTLSNHDRRLPHHFQHYWMGRTMRSKCALATRPPYPQELPCSRDTREWGVETSLRCTLVELLAGWHARMSNRLAGKGACALCIASVSNIRLRPSPLTDMRGDA